MKPSAKTSERIKLKQIRIDASDLVRVLREVMPDGISVKATNQSQDFDGLDDLQENMQSLVGDPRFEFDAITLSLNGTYQSSNEITINHHIIKLKSDLGHAGTLDADQYRAVANKLKYRLEEFRSPLSNSNYRNALSALSAVAFSLIPLWLFKVADFGLPNDVTKSVALFAVGIVLFTAFYLTEYVIGKINGNSSVRYRVRQGFLQRNADKIGMALLGAAITAVIGIGMKWFDCPSKVVEDPAATTTVGE